MPFDGSGNFTRSMNWQSDATAGIKILASRHDTEDNNFASGLSNVLCKDGQSSPTADISWNGKKITNLAAPTNPTDAATKAYIDAVRTFSTGIVIAGADINGLVSFTSGTGFTGLSFSNTDTSWISRPGGTPANYPNRLALNSKADGTGIDNIFFTGTAIHLIGGVFNNMYAASTGGYRMMTTGWGNHISMNPASGAIVLYSTGTTSVAAGAAATIATMLAIDNGGRTESAAGVFSSSNGSIKLQPNGNANGAGTVTVQSNGDLFVPRNISVADMYMGGSTSIISGNATLGNISGSTITGYQYATTSGIYASNASALYLRPNGVASGSGQLIIASNGDITQSNGAYNMAGAFNANGNLGAANITANVQGFKPGGGSWAATSDARIKTVNSDYETGLDAILALRPVRYVYKGNDTKGAPSNLRVGQIVEEGAEEDTSTPAVPYPNSNHYQQAMDGQEFIGLVAQEVEPVMPEMVSKTSAFIDGVEVNDLRNLDTTALIFALVNAVKELSAKVEALEAAP